MGHKRIIWQHIHDISASDLAATVCHEWLEVTLRPALTTRYAPSTGEWSVTFTLTKLQFDTMLRQLGERRYIWTTRRFKRPRGRVYPPPP